MEVLFTCVCVSPRAAASSARSGSARYCVRWNLLFSCCSWRLEYMVRGFRIFFPLPFMRSWSSIWGFVSGSVSCTGVVQTHIWLPKICKIFSQFQKFINYKKFLHKFFSSENLLSGNLNCMGAVHTCMVSRLLQDFSQVQKFIKFYRFTFYSCFSYSFHMDVYYEFFIHELFRIFRFSKLDLLCCRQLSVFF